MPVFITILEHEPVFTIILEHEPVFTIIVEHEPVFTIIVEHEPIHTLTKSSGLLPVRHLTMWTHLMVRVRDSP